MKKKIAIITRQMVSGGIEKSLIDMLESIPSEKYDVTLYVMASGGEFYQFIPNWVRVKNIFGVENSIKEKIFKALKEGRFIQVFKIIYYMFLYKINKSVFKQEEYLAKIMPKDNNHYDIAISYHVPASFPVIYNIKYIKSDKKIAWIHSDIEKYTDYMNMYLEYYKEFDKIFCVSFSVLEKFNKMYPHLSNKTEIFYNIINYNKIYKLGNEGETFDDGFSGTRILTVGRITEEKGFNIIPDVVEMLIREGYNIRWYCIGEGELRDKIEDNVKEKKLKNNIVFLGTKLNPYPYFKDCDIYVQPSIHEGYCITLAEAKLFKKPIISTNFSTAKEHLINEETGLIVSFSKYEIYKGIKRLINDKNLCNNLEKNLSNKKIHNNNIEKLLRLCKNDCDRGR